MGRQTVYLYAENFGSPRSTSWYISGRGPPWCCTPIYTICYMLYPLRGYIAHYVKDMILLVRLRAKLF